MVASVEGAKVPLMLRPVEGNGVKKIYTLVGSAYVRGLINSEALDKTDAGKLMESLVLLQ